MSYLRRSLAGTPVCWVLLSLLFTAGVGTWAMEGDQAGAMAMQGGDDGFG